MKKTFLFFAALLIALLCACQKVEDVSEDASTVSEITSVVSENATEEQKYVKNIADYTVTADQNGDLYIEKYNGSDAYIELPIADQNGNKITMVYKNAFSGCDFIKGIKIGEGIISVGVDHNIARDGWSGYTEEYVEYENGFCGCKSLEELTIAESVIYFGPMNNTNIEELTVPKNVITLGWGVFGMNTELKKVTFESPNYELDIDEFSGCTMLEELILPENLKYLPRGAITNCTSLKKLVLPDGYCGEPMFLPSGCTFYVKRNSTAHKTLAEYNEREFVDVLTFTVTD